MTSLAQLGGLPTILPDSLLAQSPLWQRDIRTVKPLDLLLFSRMYAGTEFQYKAAREIQELKKYVLEEVIEDRLDEDDATILHYEPSPATFTSADLTEWLEQTTVRRRQALLFALEMNMEPRQVLELTYRDLKCMTLTALARELVNAVPRHIRLPYVFWDTLANGAVAPLFGLHETALEVSQGLGMPTLRQLYKRMVMVDTELEAESFLQDITHLT